VAATEPNVSLAVSDNTAKRDMGTDDTIAVNMYSPRSFR